MAEYNGESRNAKEAPTEERPQDKKWLIWSNEHGGWWGPARYGYFRLKTNAGRYTFEEAIEICRNANFCLGEGKPPYETMVLAED